MPPLPPPPHSTVKVQSIPPCDFCIQLGKSQVAYAECKTVLGIWANVCKAHFATKAIGLGLGLGQKFILSEKVERNPPHDSPSLGN
jgi:hypothetical protein